jgi:hypothetical protein
MALLRLTNGADILVKMSIEDAMAAVTLASGGADFVELPGDEGPIHIRPSHIIAIVDSADQKTAGFRIVSPH